jgi:hypothetical protein
VTKTKSSVGVNLERRADSFLFAESRHHAIANREVEKVAAALVTPSITQLNDPPGLDTA